MPVSDKAREAARALREHAYVRLVARHDADAYCATALLAHALRREGLDFHASFVDRLEAGVLEEADDPVVLIGLAGDAEAEPGARRIAIDSDPEAAAGADVALHADASLAALAHALAVALAPRNADLASLAFAGSLAARRHVGGLQGLEAAALDEAVRAGLARRDVALSLRGGGLLEALSQHDEPFLAGVTGRARNAKKLLSDFGLGGDVPPSLLQPADAERLGSALALRLLETNAPASAFDALFRPRIVPLKGPHAGADAGELARLAEAAASHGRGGLAVAALWPDEAAAGELGDLAAATREESVAALLKAEREVRREGRVAVADAPRARACAPLADRLALALAPAGVAVARHAEGDHATLALRSFDRALDVGALAKPAARACGGAAWGARPAARARVPAAEEQRFVKLLAEGLA